MKGREEKREVQPCGRRKRVRIVKFDRQREQTRTKSKQEGDWQRLRGATNTATVCSIAMLEADHLGVWAHNR